MPSPVTVVLPNIFTPAYSYDVNAVARSLYNPDKLLYVVSLLNVDLISKYKNLIPFVESLTELILVDYKHPEIWCSDWINHIEKLNESTIDFLLPNKMKQDSLSEVEDYRKYFWPDGSHPNRHGHRVLYDFILKNCDIF
jgi:hypothetical protein